MSISKIDKPALILVDIQKGFSFALVGVLLQQVLFLICRELLQRAGADRLLIESRKKIK